MSFFVCNWEYYGECFGIFIFYFLIEKLLARIPHVSSSGQRHALLGGACVSVRWSNMIIHRLPECTVMPYSTWCSSCKWIMVGLPPLINFLFFFFLLSLITTKIHNCLFIYCLPISILNSSNFLFRLCSSYKSFVFF